MKNTHTYISQQQYNENDIIPETKEDIALRKTLAKEYKKYLKSLTKPQRKFIKKKLSNIFWRLNNLYHIRDKKGRLTILHLNEAQQRVHQVKHNKVIILKSRQQGISTYYVAKNLDKCLFNHGISAGIQSYGLDESNKLKMRAELMIDELDPDIKELLNIRLVANNQKGMLFSNGSILKIGNFRGDTLQLLHISELAKIAKNNPAKALELKTGAFQAIHNEGAISIESTAEEPRGLFFDMWVKAERKLRLHRPFSPLDFYPIFISWVEDPDCQLHFDAPISQEALQYQKDNDLPNLTIPQLRWLSAKLEELGEDFNREYPATPELAFRQSVEGTYLLKQYNRLVSQQRVGSYPHNPSYPTYLSFDLGMNDEMVISFTQVVNGQPRLINTYHGSGEGFSHYLKVLFTLKDKYNYSYSTIFMPHDMNVRELGTGLSRLETARQMGFTNIRVLPRLSFKDSINAVRTFIDTLYINEETCSEMIDAIQLYRKKYDKQLGMYVDEDVHNIYSNYIASLRYMAQGLGYRSIKMSNANTRHINKASEDYKAKLKAKAKKSAKANSSYVII